MSLLIQRVLWGFCLWAGLYSITMAQTAQKPSGYTLQKLSEQERQRIQVDADKTTPFLSEIRSQEDIERVQRIYNEGGAFELPHFLFAIDLENHDRLYYINSRWYDLHVNFLYEQKIADVREREKSNVQYQSDARRFILGTISWQQVGQQWTYELWEGDTLSADLLAKTGPLLSNSFFLPLIFKANSSLHEERARTLGIPFVTQASIVREQPFLPLHMGKAEGRLRMIADIEQVSDIQHTDILVLQQVPLSIPPVAGVISNQASTTLSHVNVLARSWNIPNAYINDIESIVQQYDGQWVALDVHAQGYTIRPITPTTAKKKKTSVQFPKPNLNDRRVSALSDLTLADRKACGSKAATLGFLWTQQKNTYLKTHTFNIPAGFCIPFAAYHDFMQQPLAQQHIQEALATPDFMQNRLVRKQALQTLQAQLLELPMSEGWSQKIRQQWQKQLEATGVFVRSSSNAEDLPNFSGAGLFSSVPNVRDAMALERAVKQVWASVFNLEAFEAREQAQIPVDKVVMGVLVQKAVSAESSGVMVTVDPFEPSRYQATYVSAKKGLGIRVVEGVAQAEQVIYVEWSDAIQVLSRSQDQTALALDPQGGVQEIAIEAERVVLTDDRIRRLAKLGKAIQYTFAGTPQDIEWVIDSQGAINIVQSRPFAVR